MRPALVLGIALVLAVLAASAHSEDKKDPYAGQFPGHIAKSDPLKPEDEQKAFHLPLGFEVQLVASEPDIHKPINMTFDDRGRLWITESVEYPFPAGPDKKPRDSVKILEDFGPDGRARKITTWADGLNIPIGLLPLPGAKPQQALVHSIPNIWKMTDTEGKGRADKREVLYGKIGYDDTHGMTSNFTIGFDGWVYASHGFRNTSTVTAADGSSVTMTSGNFYRMKVDGSHVEPYAFGQVNPFGLAWDPLGNLYSSDCETKAVWQLLREAYYPSFGRPDDGLGFGPELIQHNHGSTAIAGIIYYAADHFPKEYRDTLFVGNVVTNRINHDKLQRHGSSFHGTKQPDFLVSDDPWFRPVNLQLGPDGAIYVADFYNRIIGHYEVPLDHPGRDRERGRIWRIIYTGPDGKQKPTAPRLDWTTASVDELIKDLNHPNLTVRMKAMNQLVERGDKATKKVLGLFPTARTEANSSAWQRMHGLWVLARTGALEDTLLTSAVHDPEFGVRVHAQRVLAEKSKWGPALHKLALAGLKDSDPNVQRAAVEALARHPDPENIRPLLDLRHAVPNDDPQLLHGARIALRDQLRPDGNWTKLPTKDNWTDRDIWTIASVALGVPSAPAAAYLMKYIDALTSNPGMLARFVQHIARYGATDATRALVGFVTGFEPDNLSQQVALFHAVDRGAAERGVGLDPDVRKWATDLTARLFDSKNDWDLRAAAEMAGALKLAGHQEQLVKMATNAAAPEAQRAAAVNALAAIDVKKNAATLGKVLTEAQAPMGLREQTVRLLAAANQAETQEQLVLALPPAPARLQNVIAAALAATKTGAGKLFDAVAAGKASARLLQEQAVKVKLAESKLPDWKDRVAKLTEGLPSADQKLAALLKERHDSFVKHKGDSALGAKIFEKHCAVCHTIANQGAKVGPQLDGIGIRGLDRVLEDVLDPNRNVDQAFRSTVLNLKDGKIVTGLLLKEEGEVYVMADAQGKEVRVAKKAVDEKLVSPTSPMPANFADQIPETDFNDLMAYLLSQTVKADEPKPK
jgi:putative heme-binding domain-containing protein